MNRLALLVLCAVTCHFGCADRYKRSDTSDDDDRALADTSALTGVACPSNELMRVVTNSDGTTFCIDAFEASVDDGALGNASQTSDETANTLDGSTLAQAELALQVTPAAGVSYYQAKAACENAGKRLCSVDEWERACRGPDSFVYPYGDTIDETACNGFFNYGSTVLATGSLDTCGSAYGVYDLSGNLAEWTASSTERTPGTGIFNDRAVRGGSYAGNLVGLRCVGDDYHEPPGSARADLGFRCCL